MEFERNLASNGADFPEDLISSVYALVTKMLPECFTRKQLNFVSDDREEVSLGSVNEGASNDKNELASLFPGLARKNANAEEIDLFGDLDTNAGNTTRASK